MLNVRDAFSRSDSIQWKGYFPAEWQENRSPFGSLAISEQRVAEDVIEEIMQQVRITRVERPEVRHRAPKGLFRPPRP